VQFKEEVLKTFYKVGRLRDIFSKHFKRYENKTNEKITSKKERFGISIVDDKASFFDEWHVHYVGWGENYGRDLASGEDSYLLDDIAKDCKEITKEEFEATLAKIKNQDDIVIFATNIAFWGFFEDSNSFKPKWHIDIKQLDVKGFSGWYEFNGQSIPVFKTYHRKIDKQILILNKSRVGQFTQLSPLNEGEKEESVEDIFYMDIQAFSENKELMEEFIKKPPEWLKKIGDEQKQSEYLRERVCIQIFERFEYKKPEDFEGYKLFLKED
jgi:SpoVK/Ycf46/Vps4 family AAA+-type ATPase